MSFENRRRHNRQFRRNNGRLAFYHDDSLSYYYGGNNLRYGRSRRNGRFNSNTSCSSSSSGSNNTNQNAVNNEEDSDEIPGFYYDREKKRHFRLLPGHNNFNPITRESIRRKESFKNKKSMIKNSESVLSIRDKLHLGSITDNCYKYKVMEKRLSNLKLVLKQPTTDTVLERNNQDECAFLLTHPEISEIIGFCYDNHYDVIRLMKWKLGVKRPNQKDECGSNEIVLKKAITTWNFSGKVTDVCLAKTEQYVDCALFCFVGRLNSGSKAVMAPLVDPVFQDPDDAEFHISFELGRSAVWSCAWSHNTQSVAFGLEGKSLVMDGFTMAQQHIYTKKQNPLAVCFSSTGKELYSGTNKSAIVCSDLRESVDRHCTYSFPVSAPVTHMQLLSEHSLLISGHQNQLCTIDLRARKCLQTYAGHVNEHSKIQASVDINEDVLCSAGQDCVVRLWSLSTGKLQTEIHPPCPVRSTEMAASWFCSTPKNVSPALIIVAKNDIFMYQT